MRSRKHPVATTKPHRARRRQRRRQARGAGERSRRARASPRSRVLKSATASAKASTAARMPPRVPTTSASTTSPRRELTDAQRAAIARGAGAAGRAARGRRARGRAPRDRARRLRRRRLPRAAARLAAGGRRGTRAERARPARPVRATACACSPTGCGSRTCVARHPEILDVAIARPIIVAGLPRSGTTHLVNLISADHAAALAAVLGEPRAGARAGGDAGPGATAAIRAAPRWRSAYGETSRRCRYCGACTTCRPSTSTRRSSCRSSTSAPTARVVARPPRWRDYYLGARSAPHYAYLKKVLQALTWLRGRERWVLKSPQHLEQLGPLLARLPDATVVLTHRDPVSVIQSAITMLAYGERMRRRASIRRASADYWIDRVERLLRACVRDRELPARGAVDRRPLRRVHGRRLRDGGADLRVRRPPDDAGGARGDGRVPRHQPARQARARGLRPRGASASTGPSAARRCASTSCTRRRRGRRLLLNRRPRCLRLAGEREEPPALGVVALDLVERLLVLLGATYA